MQPTDCVEDCCAYDVLYDAVCIDGEWRCSGDHPYTTAECFDLAPECTCEDMPRWPADVCDASGEMRCNLTEEVAADWCDQMRVCTTCNGFDGPVEIDGCRCHCTEGGWVSCNREAAPTGP